MARNQSENSFGGSTLRRSDFSADAPPPAAIAETVPSPVVRTAPQWCLLGWLKEGTDGARVSPTERPMGTADQRTRIAVVELDSAGAEQRRREFLPEQLPITVASIEEDCSPRWVWSDTASWYPKLLTAGVRVSRCHDLRLSHAILKRAQWVPTRERIAAYQDWDAGLAEPENPGAAEPLFDLTGLERRQGVPQDLDAALAEFARQRAALRDAEHRGNLRVLLAAESAGALLAAELSAAGVPWDTEEHERILHESLGPRPAPGQKPAKMVALAATIRRELRDPSVSIDSPPQLLAALRRSGIDVSSTSKWELAEHAHPVIAPLLRYKQLARLLSANGWAWLDDWVRERRYRPVYVPGGVVTGRWAASGGGALQLPRQLRGALHADPGWVLVSADVAQLEPRTLAAISGDRALAQAAYGSDLYQGIVASGAVATRDEAKFAVLGAMYGATSGESGRLVPRLRRSYPAAMQFVDRAAALGEQGKSVTTWLGRSSPLPEESWLVTQHRATLPGATGREEDRARREAREFGRFTRNFVVQGSAAEWALVWLADLRQRLVKLPEISAEAPAAPASGALFARRAHLVFFLHDEVIVHAPREQAEAAAEAIRTAADTAAKMLFGDAPVDFPLDLRITERAIKD